MLNLTILLYTIASGDTEIYFTLLAIPVILLGILWYVRKIEIHLRKKKEDK